MSSEAVQQKVGFSVAEPVKTLRAALPRDYEVKTTGDGMLSVRWGGVTFRGMLMAMLICALLATGFLAYGGMDLHGRFAQWFIGASFVAPLLLLPWRADRQRLEVGPAGLRRRSSLYRRKNLDIPREEIEHLYAIETRATGDAGAMSELWAKLVDGRKVHLHTMLSKKSVHTMEVVFNQWLGVSAYSGSVSASMSEETGTSASVGATMTSRHAHAGRPHGQFLPHATVDEPLPRHLSLSREGENLRITQRPAMTPVVLMGTLAALALILFLMNLWFLASDPAGFSAALNQMWNQAKHAAGGGGGVHLGKAHLLFMTGLLFLWLALGISQRLRASRASQILMTPKALIVDGFETPGAFEGYAAGGSWRDFMPWRSQLPHREIEVREGMCAIFSERISYRYVRYPDGQKKSYPIAKYDVALKNPEKERPEFVARLHRVKEARFICQEIGRFYEIPWGIEVDESDVSLL